MKILALEFSTHLRSAAFGGREVIDESGKGSPIELLRKLEVNPAEIEGIAIGLGPGSYTGIRSALALAQGLNLARNTAAAGISSTDVIALGAIERGIAGEVEVVVDAQRGEVYSARYELTSTTFTQTHPLQILQRPQTNKIVGPEAKRWDPNGILVAPMATALERLARRAKFVSPELLEPIYLREPSFVKAPAVRHA